MSNEKKVFRFGWKFWAGDLKFTFRHMPHTHIHACILRLVVVYAVLLILCNTPYTPAKISTVTLQWIFSWSCILGDFVSSQFIFFTNDLIFLFFICRCRFQRTFAILVRAIFLLSNMSTAAFEYTRKTVPIQQRVCFVKHTHNSQIWRAFNLASFHI